MCVYRHHILGSTADSQRAAALRLHSDTETLADDQMQWPVSLTHILRLVRLHGDSFVPYQRLGSAVHRKRYTSCVDVNRIGADMGEQGSRRIWVCSRHPTNSCTVCTRGYGPLQEPPSSEASVEVQLNGHAAKPLIQKLGRNSDFFYGTSLT